MMALELSRQTGSNQKQLSVLYTSHPLFLHRSSSKVLRELTNKGQRIYPGKVGTGKLSKIYLWHLTFIFFSFVSKLGAHGSCIGCLLSSLEIISPAISI